MKLRDLVNDHIQHHELCPGALTINDWVDKEWLTVQLEEKVVKVFPLWGARKALRMHDMHHVLTGYPTSIEGEIQLAAWEVGSGGCHLNLLFWFDRLALAFYGLVREPKITRRAYRYGKTCKNLYGKSLDYVLDRDVADIKAELAL